MLLPCLALTRISEHHSTRLHQQQDNKVVMISMRDFKWVDDSFSGICPKLTQSTWPETSTSCRLAEARARNRPEGVVHIWVHAIASVVLHFFLMCMHAVFLHEALQITAGPALDNLCKAASAAPAAPVAVIILGTVQLRTCHA